MSSPCREACSARSTDFLQAVDEKTPSSRFSNREFTLLMKLHSLASKGGCQMFSNQTQKVAAHATSCVFTDYRYNLHVTLNRKVGHKWTRKKASAPGSDLSSQRVFGALHVFFLGYLKLGNLGSLATSFYSVITRYQFRGRTAVCASRVFVAVIEMTFCFTEFPNL
jgi:hypothetical protein